MNKKVEQLGRIINLDNAAATRLLPESLEAMMPYMTGEKYLNPSAPYLQALEVRREYDEVKNRLAHTIGATGENLIITSGATEANNLAFSVLSGLQGSVSSAIDDLTNAEVLISPFEHPSVRDIPLPRPVVGTADGLANISINKKIIKADKSGIINLCELKKQITPRTVLISVGVVASDIGTIQPLREVAEMVREERQKRLRDGNRTPIWLHTDASQGFEAMEMNVARFGVDMMTINSGKMHGPKGVGALFVKPAVGIKLIPLLYGGGQEKGLKSGTENVAGVVGFAFSAEYLHRHRYRVKKGLETFKRTLKMALAAQFEGGIMFIGNSKRQLASFLPVVFRGYDAERLIFALEKYGVLVSTGSACAANKGEKSESLKAIGLTDEEIAGSLRLSFSINNKIEEIPEIIEAFKAAVVEANRL